MPNSIAKSEQDFTASYSLESSPLFPDGHIQFADSDTDFNPSSKGAHIIFVNASAIEFILPFLGSIRPEIGECPMEVAIP